MTNYDQLIDLALVELESCETLEILEKVRVKYFGKNGEVTGILKSLSNLSETEKKDVGKKINLFLLENRPKFAKSKPDLEWFTELRERKDSA